MDVKIKLEKLNQRLKEIKPITSKTFNTSSELQKYVKKNIKAYEEAQSIQEEIERLEYELLSPEEKEKYDEYRKLSKLKAEGKPLI